MKKTLLATFVALILFSLPVLAQPVLVVEAPLHNSTTQLRAPNSTSLHAYHRGCFLILGSELSIIPSSTTLTNIGFTLSAGSSGNLVSGNFTVYLQNTTDVTYQKGTTFSSALSGMTQVYASTMSVPNSVGTASVLLTLSTPFVYTGGGLYVATDWASTGPFNTSSATYYSESLALPLPGGGGAVEYSGTTTPSTLTPTNFRPSFIFEFNPNPYSNDMQVVAMSAPGKVPAMFNTGHSVNAIVKNGSAGTLSSINVSLNVTGANPFTDVVTISSLAAGASTLINFATFNPVTVGMNSIVVSVPSDQYAGNNFRSLSQSVTCNQWAQNPPTGTYTNNSVGFTNGSGILGVQYFNPVASTLTAIRVAISSNTPAIGNSFYGALLSATGTTLAVSNPVSITSSMLGTFIDLPLTTPYVMSANTAYYLGGAQTANTSLAWFPFGTQASSYIPPNIYAYTGLAGGALTILTQNFGYFGLEGVFQPTITLAVTPQTVTCGSTAIIQATSSTNYSWSTGPTTSSISVSPTVTTVYTVVATNTMGCSNTKTVTLTIAPLPINITASADTICLGSSVNLSASGASSYTWSAGTNPNSSSISDSPQQTTVYTVTGTIPAGCSNTKQVLVAVRNFSTMSVPVASHTICLGNTAALVANGAQTYTWETGSGTQNGPNLFVSPTVNTTYTVTGADNLGCSMSKTVAVNVINVPLVVSADTAVCFGSPLTLTATGANSFVWTNGFSSSPFQNYLISTVTVSANYTVTGTGQMNCTTTSIVAVTMNTLPVVSITANRLTMCKNEKNLLTASGANTYSWSNGALTNTVMLNPTNNLQINLKVWGIDANGCKDDASIIINVSNCVGMGELAGRIINVYPNPGSGIFYLTVDDDFATDFFVTNSLGELVQAGAVLNGNTTIDLSDKPNGVYLITVKTGELQTSTRVIKQ